MSVDVKVAETSRDPSAVTSVIRHTVRAGSESRYEAWFRKVTAIAQTLPGHRGVDFIRPPKGSRTYTAVLHFDTSEHLGRWLSSDAHKRRSFHTAWTPNRHRRLNIAAIQHGFRTPFRLPLRTHRLG